MNHLAFETPPSVPALEQCRFAVHRICSLGERHHEKFGGQWDWFEMLVRPVTKYFAGSPYEFIRRLYRDHAPEQVDQAIICRASAWLAGRRRPTQLSVNIHPGSLIKPFFLDQVIAVQKRLTPLRHSICLELVEFGECLDRAALIESARGLRKRDVKIVLDDFGTHFNCFDLCVAGVVDVIKIDAVMVRELDSNPYQRAVVDSIQALGSGIGASVIAEGVENPEVVARLRHAGVEYAQGFYFHKPELAGI